jgi:phage terminase large subunit
MSSPSNVLLSLGNWKYEALPKQLAFHQSMAPYRLHIGGYGSGKTLNLLMEAVMTCVMVPGCNCLILRTTSPDIQKTVINKFLDTNLIPRSLYKHYNKNEKIAYFHNDSQLHFGYCQRDDDVNQFLSTEYVFIGLEEAGEFSYRVWEHLVGRARASKTVVDIQGNQVKPSMGLTTNPFGTGYPWIKQLFGCRNDGLNGYGSKVYGMGKYNPNDYFYVHSTVKDNPFTYTPEYVEKLESMTGSLRNQALFGDVDEVAGQAYPQFNTGQHQGIHVMDVKDITFKSYDPIWIGSDWDFAHWPILWFRKGWIPDALNGGMRCVNVCYRELILREYNAVNAAQEIARVCPPNNPREKLVRVTENIKAFYFSWERFKRQGMDHTIAEQLGTNLVRYGIPRPTAADSSRIDGWALIGQLLDMDELVVTTDCPTVISTLPVLTRDTDELGDIKKTESLEDDVADAFRYGLKSFLKPGKIPQAVKDQMVLDAIQSPMAKSIKAFEQYCRKMKPDGPIKLKRALPWQVR